MKTQTRHHTSSKVAKTQLVTALPPRAHNATHCLHHNTSIPATKRGGRYDLSDDNLDSIACAACMHPPAMENRPSCCRRALSTNPARPRTLSILQASSLEPHVKRARCRSSAYGHAASTDHSISVFRCRGRSTEPLTASQDPEASEVGMYGNNVLSVSPQHTQSEIFEVKLVLNVFQTGF